MDSHHTVVHRLALFLRNLLPAQILLLGGGTQGTTERIPQLHQFGGDVPLFPLLPLWQYRASLLGTGSATDGQPLVLPCGDAIGVGLHPRSAEMAHLADGMDIAAPYVGYVPIALDGLHVLQALS